MRWSTRRSSVERARDRLRDRRRPHGNAVVVRAIRRHPAGPRQPRSRRPMAAAPTPSSPELNSTGTAFTYSSYLGGSSERHRLQRHARQRGQDLPDRRDLVQQLRAYRGALQTTHRVTPTRSCRSSIRSERVRLAGLFHLSGRQQEQRSGTGYRRRPGGPGLCRRADGFQQLSSHRRCVPDQPSREG